MRKHIILLNSLTEFKNAHYGIQNTSSIHLGRVQKYGIHLHLHVLVGQLYGVAAMSKEETSGGDGVEILKNEPFENKEMGKGQYTYKIYKITKYVNLICCLNI